MDTLKYVDFRIPCVLQGMRKSTYFKMFLNISDDVTNILDKEGQSEEESHLADECWI